MVYKSPTHYPCDIARTFRVIFLSTHSDEWKSFQCQHQTALRGNQRLSQPNLDEWRFPIPAESDSEPHAHTQDIKFQVIKKAQDKDFCYSDDQHLP
ncbi:hypothetical protein Tco_0226466 [Tanacetum coccineum]